MRWVNASDENQSKSTPKARNERNEGDLRRSIGLACFACLVCVVVGDLERESKVRLATIVINTQINPNPVNPSLFPPLHKAGAIRPYTLTPHLQTAHARVLLGVFEIGDFNHHCFNPRYDARGLRPPHP